MNLQPYLASVAGLALAAAGLAQTPPAADPTLAPAADQAKKASEPDIIVTGSLIRRSDFQLSSPVQLYTRKDLEARAPQNIAEFVKDIPGNFGSAFASGRAFGNERGGGTINLRGLGASATLVLVNFRRQTQLPDSADNVVDVNSLIPEIMLDRVDILKDGTSALYGSDAVAGVANFITNDKFSGVRINARANEWTYAKAKDYHAEAMVGTDVGSRFHATMAVGYHYQDPINGYAYTTPSQNPSDVNNIRFTSPSSGPGEFIVPTRNAAGVLSGTRANVVDPLCGTIVSTIASNTVGGLGVPAASPATAVDCRYNFWGDNGSQSKIWRYTTMARLTGDLFNGVRFEGELGYTYIRSETPYTAGDTLSSAVTIPGTNPGNIYYRAVNAAGQPLYAVSSGVDAGFQRDGAQVFLPTRDASGRVVLTATPTDPTSGIPFYEDVQFSGRPMNSQCDLPTGNTMKPGECAWSRPSVAKNNVFRAASSLSGQINSNWHWQGGFAYSRYQEDTNGTVGVALVNELNYALQGLGGTGCNRAANTPGRNGCSYINLFGNSAVATPGSAAANTQAVIDYVMPYLHDQYTSSLMTGDLLLTGNLLTLPAGPVGIAVGYQYRRATLAIDYDTEANIGNKANGVTQVDLNRARDNNAFFMEANVPIFHAPFGYAEFNGAFRHEQIGSDLHTDNPKFGLLFNTNDRKLSLRASYGTSFIAPSLFRLYADSASGTAVNDCPASQGAPCRGDLNLRVALLQKGNPTLKPERSKSYSAGITLKPFRGLTLDASYWRFHFKDKIVTPSATQIVAANPNGTALTPVVRDATGRIISVTTVFSNAASVLTDGIDFSVDYRTAIGRFGDLNFNIDGTYLNRFNYQATVGAAVYEGAGSSNDTLASGGGPVQPSTKFRANGRVTWTYKGGTFNAIVHYYAPIDFALTAGYKLDAWYPIDFNYTYNFKLRGATMQLGVGLQNAFQMHEPFVPVPGFQPFIPSLYDVRGRAAFVKAGITF